MTISKKMIDHPGIETGFFLTLTIALTTNLMGQMEQISDFNIIDLQLSTKITIVSSKS